MVSGELIERVIAYGSYWDFNESGGLARTGSLASLHSSLCANVVGSCRADSLAFLAGSPNTASLTERNSVGQASGSSVATEGTSAGQAGGGGAAQDEQGRAPGEPEVLELAAITQQMRVISYSYDGLLRLTGADYSTGASFSYSYDLAGNRSDGGRSYNAANQVVGWSYDGAGNLVSDGATSYTYDALGRMTSRGGVSYGYNGDGALVSAGATRYAQDLAAPLSQVLSDGTTNYLYGRDRLAAQSAGTTTWYASDALGSVRQTLDNAGAPLATASYDPWGTPQGSAISPFGFTGELQDAAGLTYLRARWYTPGTGTFLAVDPFQGFPEQPYSQHPFQYAYSNPVLWRDPSGKCVEGWDGYCYTDPVPDDWRPPTREEWIQTGSRSIDASPGIGDLKGLIEVFTGCDIITGENLGNWRWLGLIGLHELRIARPLSDAATTFGDAYAVTRQWHRANNEILLVLTDTRGQQLRITTDKYLEDMAMVNAARVTPKPGYLDVFIHSNEESFVLRLGRNRYAFLPDEVVAEIIRNANPNNFKIRLFACHAGSCSKGPAQRLANLLGQDVESATTVVTVSDTGKYSPPARDWVRKRPE